MHYCPCLYKEPKEDTRETRAQFRTAHPLRNNSQVFGSDRPLNFK